MSILDGSGPFEGERSNNAFNRLVQAVKSLGSATSKVTSGWFSVLRADELQLNAEGDDAVMGTATLVAGTVTVETTKVLEGSIIQLTGVGTTAAGHLTIGTITEGTSFVINSSSGTDARVVHWELKNPQA